MAKTAIQVEGIEAVQAVLAHIAKDKLSMARGALRDGSQKIATEHLIPALKAGAAASGVPMAPKIAETARARKDRIVYVQVGAVNPKLSGFSSKSRDAAGRTFRTALALGSNYGPTDPEVNHYAVGRTRSGHWVQPTVNSAGTHRRVQDAYRRLLADILHRYGRGF